MNISLDNLLRLRLIEERFSLEKPSIDEKNKNSLTYVSLANELQKYIVDDTWEYEETPQYFYLTKLGTSFCSICLEMS